MQKMLVLTLYNLILHSSMRWPVSQCFLCVVTNSAQKTRFLGEKTRFRALTVVLALKKVV